MRDENAPRQRVLHAWRGPDAWALFSIILFGLWRLAPGLDHPNIHGWDEGLHQAAARGTYDSPLSPHIYVQHLFPHDTRDWLHAGIWVHKPTGPFWFAAALMHGGGVRPLALRIASLLGELAAACALYLLARDLTHRLWAWAVALAYLALPFGWILTQGEIFGDVTDVTLTGWVATAMVCLVWAVDRGSWRWGAAAGAATGVAYLCKSGLALTPLGVVCSLWLLGRLGFCRGPTGRTVLAMMGVAVGAAAPWNVYCRFKWPAEWHAAALISRAQLFHMPEVDIGPWSRPIDAVFSELNATEFRPLPAVLMLAAGLWLVVRALRKRQTAAIACALWLWATWLVMSLADAKVPALVWGAAPAATMALAVLFADAWNSLPLALATLAGIFTPRVIAAFPATAGIRTWIPAFLPHTRRVPGIAEGLLFMLVAAAAGWGIARVSRSQPWIGTTLKAVASAAAVWLLLWETPRAQAAEAESRSRNLAVSYTQDVGRALDINTPKRSVVFEELDRDPPQSFELLNLMFWSGRMVYQRAPDITAVRQAGYHPYLVSPMAQPFKPVGGVPAAAWLRAYDLEAPGPMADLPSDLTPLHANTGDLEVLGVAWMPVNARYTRYAFYVRPVHGLPGPLTVRFQMGSQVETQQLLPAASLVAPWKLRDAPWFVLPTVGPPRNRLTGLGIGPAGETVPLPRGP